MRQTEEKKKSDFLVEKKQEASALEFSAKGHSGLKRNKMSGRKAIEEENTREEGSNAQAMVSGSGRKTEKKKRERRFSIKLSGLLSPNKSDCRGEQRNQKQQQASFESLEGGKKENGPKYTPLYNTEIKKEKKKTPFSYNKKKSKPSDKKKKRERKRSRYSII